jgi:hypothetical protein
MTAATKGDRTMEKIKVDIKDEALYWVRCSALKRGSVSTKENGNTLIMFDALGKPICKFTWEW